MSDSARVAELALQAFAEKVTGERWKQDMEKNRKTYATMVLRDDDLIKRVTHRLITRSLGPLDGMTAIAHAMGVSDWWLSIMVYLPNHDMCVKTFNWWVVEQLKNPDQMWWGEIVEVLPYPIVPPKLADNAEVQKYNDALLEWGRGLKAGPPQGGGPKHPKKFREDILLFDLQKGPAGGEPWLPVETDAEGRHVANASTVKAAFEARDEMHAALQKQIQELSAQLHHMNEQHKQTAATAAAAAAAASAASAAPPAQHPPPPAQHGAYPPPALYAGYGHGGYHQPYDHGYGYGAPPPRQGYGRGANAGGGYGRGQGQGQGQVRCYNCGGLGHIGRECRERRGVKGGEDVVEGQGKIPQ
jgi:hypothetical protein